jgi:hypothetical protein
MKIILLIAFLVIVVAISIKKTNAQISQTSTSSSIKPEDNPYLDLRQKALSVLSEDMELSIQPNKVYGIVMDMGMDSSIVTVVSFATGDASIYLSSGGGFIGGSNYETIKTLSQQFVTLSNSYLEAHQLVTTENFPLPQDDQVHFFLLTGKGIFFTNEQISNFENNSSQLTPLFIQANYIMSAFREKQQ